jgi:hypothetical protein
MIMSLAAAWVLEGIKMSFRMLADSENSRTVQVEREIWTATVNVEESSFEIAAEFDPRDAEQVGLTCGVRRTAADDADLPGPQTS